MSHRDRAGFALLVTLWAVVGAAALGLAAAGTARTGLGASRNRANHTRAYWDALGCTDRARHLLHELLWSAGQDMSVTNGRWSALDAHASALSRQPGGCRYGLQPAGLTANVNTIPAARLRRLMLVAGVSELRADSLVDALLDWRDADDVPRPFGAEREWYASRHLPAPRNAPLPAPEELVWVRGFDSAPELLPLLGVNPERILWVRASRPVLASLPGMNAEALAVLESRRREITEIAAIGAFPEMSAGTRDEIARAGPLLVRGTTVEPEAWILRASAAAGSPAITVEIEARLVLADGRVAVVERVVRP